MSLICLLMLDCNAILPSNGICNHQHDASLCALSLGHLDQCHKCFSQPSHYILCMSFLRCTFFMCNSSSPHVTNAKNVFPKQVSSKRTSKSAGFVLLLLLPINFMSIKSPGYFLFLAQNPQQCSLCCWIFRT